MNDTIDTSATVESESRRHRARMAEFLELALMAMNDLRSTVDFVQRFRPIDQRQVNEDPMALFRRTNQLLIAKARLHVVAALKANRMSNIHSVAVQMRPALECAGQVVSQVGCLLSRSRKEQSGVLRHLLSDYIQLLRRTSKAHVDPRVILRSVVGIIDEREAPAVIFKTARESEKVRDLEFGNSWYRHLSRSFYHSEPAALRGASYYGGVGSCNTPADQYAFAQFLDYLTHQMLVMLMYEAVCAAARRDVVIPTDARVKKMMDLLSRKKTVTERFAATLKATGNQQNQ